MSGTRLMVQCLSVFRFMLVLAVACSVHATGYKVHAQDAAAPEATDHSASESTEATVCQDPFCTYGPPRLGGGDMAAAAREIMAAAKTVKYGFLTERWLAEEAFMDAFLRNEQFEFFSPYHIAENKDDPRLVDYLGAACIEDLTQIDYANGPTSIFSGPFFLFKLEQPVTASAEYVGIFVFGGATIGQVKGMSFGERVKRAQSAGYFYLLDPAGPCDIVYEHPISGRGEKEFVARYTPRLAGVGLYDGALFLYTLQSANSPVDAGQTYTFQWHLGIQRQADGRWSPKSYGLARLSDFPGAFDPFSIVDSKEPLR